MLNYTDRERRGEKEGRGERKNKAREQELGKKRKNKHERKTQQLHAVESYLNKQHSDEPDNSFDNRFWLLSISVDLEKVTEHPGARVSSHRERREREMERDRDGESWQNLSLRHHGHLSSQEAPGPAQHTPPATFPSLFPVRAQRSLTLSLRGPPTRT